MTVELNSYPTLLNDANLVSYWRMEGNSNDSKGSNNGSGVIPDETAVVYSTGNGKFGQGAGFDGYTADILVNSPVGLNLLNNFSISLWFKTSADYSWLDGGLIRRDTASGTRNLWGIELRQNKVGIQTYNSSAVSEVLSAVTVNDGNWHHVVGTMDSSNVLKLYLDGSASGTPVTAGALTQYPNGHLCIGANPDFVGYPLTAQNLLGCIDDVSIFSRVLSSSEVASYYASTGNSVYTLTAVTRSFSLTGISNLFHKTLRMLVTSQTFTLTGIDNLLKKGWKMSVSTSNFTINSFSIALRYIKKIWNQVLNIITT